MEEHSLDKFQVYNIFNYDHHFVQEVSKNLLKLSTLTHIALFTPQPLANTRVLLVSVHLTFKSLHVTEMMQDHVWLISQAKWPLEPLMLSKRQDVSVFKDEECSTICVTFAHPHMDTL